jgi:hypothetical protein
MYSSIPQTYSEVECWSGEDSGVESNWLLVVGTINGKTGKTFYRTAPLLRYFWPRHQAKLSTVLSPFNIRV